ncbi:GIY-YIG nuclease family protein [Chlorobium sp. BLA1]|uniref:GIY-YIG nuclease family protein n=1 Tax=Candidatus Chlorobium masyuteum TaxID=2716876 RepID=UPI0014232788|nr:GIY-YIG nuclease family protein [Candidatus Chlorobium masyuteum]NHQ59478.1 GIY-YIG nuclease family protein [Candidatus Chlorobium masyuteum]
MSRDRPYCVYILTNRTNKVMYVGMTNDLVRRVREHKSRMIDGFTKKYNVDKLVYFEETTDVLSAIAREKEIKKWRREKKDLLDATLNPEWKDLGHDGVW